MVGRKSLEMYYLFAWFHLCFLIPVCSCFWKDYPPSKNVIPSTRLWADVGTAAVQKGFRSREYRCSNKGAKLAHLPLRSGDSCLCFVCLEFACSYCALGAFFRYLGLLSQSKRHAFWLIDVSKIFWSAWVWGIVQNVLCLLPWVSWEKASMFPVTLYRISSIEKGWMENLRSGKVK